MEKSLKGSKVVEARAELVERLRREIKEGAYSPDSRKVADKMIAEAAKTLDED
jgi:anti-sigma28 factor (negative regulator of flagellin synthesis)